MANDVSLSKSLLNAFGTLNLSNNPCLTPNKNDTIDTQEPNGAHDLTCRTPKTEGDTDNSDDTESVSDAILVVDSCASSDVSFMWISDSSAISKTNSGTEDCASNTDTIPETDSEINVDDSTDCDLLMDNRKSTPIKRKHNGTPANLTTQQSTPLTENPKKITTRSGRSVRQRVDLKFDYTSEHHDVDSEISDDPAFYDEDKDSDKDDHDYNLPLSGDAARRQRRISMRSSCCSSSSSVVLDTDAFIYLDLREQAAIASMEPTTDAVIELDSELKTRIQKFLGLIPARRRLYNPNSMFECDDDNMDEDEPAPAQQSRFSASTHKLFMRSDESSQITEPADRALTIRSTTLHGDMDNNTRMLLVEHMVQRINAQAFEMDTPQHIKEPIDLSGLPTDQQREQICRRHKQTANLIGPYPNLYGFVDSLKATTPPDMCHPLAIDFRKRSFETSKAPLAKTLFNFFNHTVFHCGLRSKIIWKSGMNTTSAIQHRIEVGGKLVSNIILWKNIKRSEHLINALVHEMCHAAAFEYHREIGHGDHCRRWAYRAKTLLPELQEIRDCDPSYTYTCLLCRRRSHGHIKFEDEAPQLRCHYCQFEVAVERYMPLEFLSLSLTDLMMTPYKEFVRANYMKCEQTSHSAKMRILNVMYKEQQEHALQTNS